MEKSRSLIPVDRIGIRLLTVHGNDTQILNYPSDNIRSILDNVYSNWPAEWDSQLKPDRNILRIIYQGRFLHDNVKLSDLSLALGRVTVMHLISRENLPEAPLSDDSEKKKTDGRRCCLIL